MNTSLRTAVGEIQKEHSHSNASVRYSLSTNRPTFTAANQVLTLTRVTNERIVPHGHAPRQFNLVYKRYVHILWIN